MTLGTFKRVISHTKNRKISKQEYVRFWEVQSRIVGHQIVKLKPSVLQLPVHLESLNAISCNVNVPNSQIKLDNNIVITLKQHYETNSENEENMNILCKNMLNKFMWNKDSKMNYSAKPIGNSGINWPDNIRTSEIRRKNLLKFIIKTQWKWNKRKNYASS